MRTRIYDVLYELGLYASTPGFLYTVHAVYLAVNSPDRVLLSNEWLYPEVAAHYKTTPDTAIRGIASAAETAWSLNKRLLKQLSRGRLTGPPSATQFVELLAALFLNDKLPA